MPINRLLQDHAFGPEDIAVIVAAFEDALRALRLIDRTDPATEMVASKIIEFAKLGERDRARLRDLTVDAFSGHRPTSA
jgi:hypothetical protein